MHSCQATSDASSGHYLPCSLPKTVLAQSESDRVNVPTTEQTDIHQSHHRDTDIESPPQNWPSPGLINPWHVMLSQLWGWCLGKTQVIKTQADNGPENTDSCQCDSRASRVMEAKSFYSAINDGCGQLMMPTCTAMTTDDAYLYSDDNWWCLPVLWSPLHFLQCNKWWRWPTCTVIPFGPYSCCRAWLKKQTKLCNSKITSILHVVLWKPTPRKEEKNQSNGIYIYMAQIHNTVSLK